MTSKMTIHAGRCDVTGRYLKDYDWMIDASVDGGSWAYICAPEAMNLYEEARIRFGVGFGQIWKATDEADVYERIPDADADTFIRDRIAVRNRIGMVSQHSKRSSIWL